MIKPLSVNPNYGVTPSGQVYSYAKNKYLTPVYSWGVGYPMVNLKSNGKQKLYYIHRLVAMTFIPNPDNKREVNHINGNKRDCRAENLEWVSSSENIQHAYNNGLHTDNMRIAMCDDNGHILKVYNSQSNAQLDGFDQRLISRAIRKGFRHKGYFWREVMSDEADS